MVVNSERITENNSNGNQATAGEIAALIEEIAPVSIQMSFDNSGFLVGSRESKVNRVMLALEVSDDVIKDAIKQECQMIITHHPLIFHAEKSVTADTYQGKLLLRLISSGIALYSSHTPLDAAPGGCNDVLCDMFGLKNVHGIVPLGRSGEREYFCARVGSVDATVQELALTACKKLGTDRVAVVDCGKRIRRLAVCSGSGGGILNECIAAGADALLTGELSHHEALALREASISAIICGHYQTEVPVLNSLLGHLQKRINVLKYNTDAVITSVVTDPYCVYTLGGVNIDR